MALADAIVVASNRQPDRLSLGQQLTIPAPATLVHVRLPHSRAQVARPSTPASRRQPVPHALRYGLTVDELAR